MTLCVKTSAILTFNKPKNRGLLYKLITEEEICWLQHKYVTDATCRRKQTYIVEFIKAKRINWVDMK